MITDIRVVNPGSSTRPFSFSFSFSQDNDSSFYISRHTIRATVVNKMEATRNHFVTIIGESY